MGMFDRLKAGLKKTKDSLVGRTSALFGRTVDEALLEELEEILITSDVGPSASLEIIDAIREGNRKKPVTDLKAAIKEQMRAIMGSERGGLVMVERPFVIMVVGVNGAGKTTTIGKLARRYSDEGLKVVLAAGDTFRAAAIEQLEIWAKRAEAQFVKHQSGSDPAAVAFDAVRSAVARNADVVIIDTAGRLHTQHNLMEELKKVHRVIQKEMPHAPHEVLLVLDATTGQNAIQQARIFNQAVGVTGIALTKLDGSAKGGVVLGVRKEIGVPVKLIGVGEQVDDLRDFDPAEFTEALFDDV